MEFTHFNEQGLARMVDVSDKNETVRIAKATAFILLISTLFTLPLYHIIEKTSL